MRRTKEEAEATRVAILDAAERLFLERGFSTVSLSEVAEAAGYTRGAVHWHFQNKVGLLIAIHDRVVLPIQDLIGKLSADKEVDPLLKLSETTTALFDELQADTRRRELLRLLTYSLPDETMEPLREQRRRFDRHFRSLLYTIFTTAEDREDLASPWTPTTATLAFQALATGLVERWLLEDDDPWLSVDGSEILRVFITSLSRT